MSPLALAWVWVLFGAASALLVFTILTPLLFHWSDQNSPEAAHTWIYMAVSQRHAIANYTFIAQALVQSTVVGTSMLLTIRALHGYNRRYLLVQRLIHAGLSTSRHIQGGLEDYVVQSGLLRADLAGEPNGQPTIHSKGLLTPDHMPKILFGNYTLSQPLSEYLEAMREERDRARKLPASLATALAGLFTANVLATVRLANAAKELV